MHGFGQMSTASEGIVEALEINRLRVRRNVDLIIPDTLRRSARQGEPRQGHALPGGTKTQRFL